MKSLSIYLLALGVFLVGTAELVFAGILNLVAADLDISLGTAGQLITAYSLAFAVGTPVITSLTSRIARKGLIIASLVAFFIGCFGSFVSMDITVLMVFRILLGLSAGIFQVVALSSVAKIVPPEKIGSAMGVIALGFGSAIAFGVPLGVAIANLFSWPFIFLFMGIASLLILYFLFRLLPNVEGDASVTFKEQFTVLKNPIIVSGLSISLFMEFGNSAMLTYLSPFLQNILHFETSNIGVIMLLLGVFGMFGSRMGGLWVDIWGSSQMISFTLLLSAFSLAFLPFITNIVSVAVALIMIWIVSIFMRGPAVQTYFIQIAPHASNLVLGLNMSFIHLGIASGAASGGILADVASTVQFNPWFSSVFFLIALASSFISFSLRKKESFFQVKANPTKSIPKT